MKMFFSEILKEDGALENVESSEVDALITPDPETSEGEEQMADQVELIMRTQAMESAYFFENGQEALERYIQHLNESTSIHEGIISASAKNNNIVQLNTRDDLKRRTNLACLMIAKSKKDPLFTKLALNRKKERQLRGAIYKKYQRQAFKIARMSQSKHAIAAKDAPVPKFQRDTSGMKTSFGAVLQ